MSAPLSQSAGARAAAVAAVKLLGGATAVLRLPSPPLANSDGEELGLPLPEFHDIPLTPCAVRPQPDGGTRVLVAAPVLESALDARDADAVRATLRAVAAVGIGGASLLLVSVDALSTAGSAYAYRITLKPGATEVAR